ncbi:MAG: four helix bundle protein [Clostridia bacterium]|nr:four helix bundle protein [Clostridia bacterium]
MKEQGNIVLEKSKSFAVRVIRLYQYLSSEKKESVLSKQLLRSGTSIGANAHEAVGASSRKDFLNKMYIALKECRETQYWLELIYMTDYLTNTEYESIANDCNELYRILSSITKSTKEN